MDLKRVLVFIICGMVVAGAAFFYFSRGPAAVSHREGTAVYPVSRQIQYRFSIENPRGTVVTGALLKAHAPVKRTPSQSCTLIESSHEFVSVEDSLHNQVLEFPLGVIAPYDTRIITVTVHMKLAEIPNSCRLPDPAPFLSAQKYLESDNDRIQRKAAEFVADNRSGTAKRIYEWVSSSLRYDGYDGKEQGALYALDQKKGDCTEFMYLFSALCRADGIPARCMAGYIIQNNALLKPAGYHNWAEVYLNGTWQTADPANKVFLESTNHYVTFRIIAGNSDDHPRFEIYPPGLKVKMI